MAAQNSKKPSQIQALMTMLEGYNISKVDLIIYASCLLVFFVSIFMFAFFSRDLVSKQREYKELSEEYDSALMLKTQEVKINEAYAVLDVSAFELRNKFLSEKQVNDFKESVKILAKKYNCDRIDATERAEPVEQVESYNVKGKDGETKVLKIKFKKRSMEFSFQMTLGNFFGFLKSLETSNKMLEVQPFRLAQGDSRNSVRLNNFVILVYVVPADLDKEIVDLIGDVNFEQNVSEVQLGEKAQVVPITEKKVLVKETVKTKDGEWDLRPVFKTFEPPPPPKVVPPVELKYFISASPVFGFVYNNDTNTPYYAKVGDVLKTREGKTIPNYDALKLIEVKQMGFVLEIDGITGELSKLRR
ncbi:MAG: hypothetical protein A2044_00100 [Candidatus Firestonebacteria bacterium GWA2_43_8]|nr:MAG: hypothetical protein A2044_00100 [Candidatus Firestonebacteria bacterium GWA2_43_8]